MPALAPVERPPPPPDSVDGWRPAVAEGECVDVTTVVVTTVVTGTDVEMTVEPVLTLVWPFSEVVVNVVDEEMEVGVNEVEEEVEVNVVVVVEDDDDVDVDAVGCGQHSF